VEQLSAPRTTYLVGGAVRDALLGRQVRDFDLAVPSGAVGLARRLAGRLGGSFVLLDEPRGCARVVWMRDGDRRVLDVADFRAPTLEDDLRARDLTINAIALPLAGRSDLIDPTGGLEDLRSGCVRLTSRDALRDDPLRALRVARFAVQTGFAVEPGTAASVRAFALRAVQVSPERLRDELLAGLEVDAPRMFQLLAELELLAATLPELVDVAAFAQTEVAALDELLQALGSAGGDCRPASLLPYRDALTERLALPLTGSSPRRAALFLAAAFSALPSVEAGVEAAQQRLGALRFSRAEQRFVTTVILSQVQLLQLDEGRGMSRRQVHRYHRLAGDWGIEAALLALARQRARGDGDLAALAERAAQVVAAAIREPETLLRPLPLLDGGELMRRFGLPAGPQIGELLAALVEEQAAGAVDSREAAVRLVERLLAEGDAV
jgi:tRNA nucleotidyltransferase/poly(A) polymerase